MLGDVGFGAGRFGGCFLMSFTGALIIWCCAFLVAGSYLSSYHWMNGLILGILFDVASSLWKEMLCC